MNPIGRQAVTAGFGILALAVPWATPEMPALAHWILWPLAAMLLAYAAVDFVRSQQTSRWRPWRRLTLTEAAALMYRRAKPFLKTIIAQTSKENDEGPIDWGRGILVVAARKKEITLFGQIAPQLPAELISAAKLTSLFSLGGDKLGYPVGVQREVPGGTMVYDKYDYINVSVSRSDTLKVLKSY